MYGFSISINGKPSNLEGDVVYQNIVCKNYMINKFKNDKVFFDSKDFIVILDGVILNKKELLGVKALGDEKENQWANKIIELYKKNGDVFFSVFKGSFAGALFDKRIEKWIIYGDQIGSKFIYYSQIGNCFMCCEMMGHMYNMLNENSLPYHLDEIGAIQLLTYGFMLDGVTLCQEVHKINPGCYLTIHNGIIKEQRYYLLSNHADETITEPEAVEIIDFLFRQAIKREFEKDNEYGYQHLVALSGGLDSRMTSFVAHDCGYIDQLNLTFSQSDYWDQTIPMRISRDLKHEWIYKSLDNGLWLYDVEAINQVTGGNVLYYGTAHGNSIFRLLNFENLGMEHSGQIGDIIVGSCINREDVGKEFELGEGAYSTKYMSYLQDYKPLLILDKELGFFYYRAFNGTNNGIQNLYNYTETLSPFLDIDFLEKSLTIPVQFRQNHKLYKKWIISKYPKAARYEWAKTSRKITTPVLRIGNREIPLLNIPSSIMTHIRLAMGLDETPNNPHAMNPISYYLAHNKDLSRYIDNFFEYVNGINNNKIKNILIELKNKGNAMEKIQAVTLLDAIRQFFTK